MSDNKLDQALNKGIKSAKDALTEKMIHMAHKESEQAPKETTYNVVFTGTFTKDEKLVIAAMAKFFKQGQESTKRLLKAGRVVKSFSDKGPADKLAKMLNSIGLACKVEMEISGSKGDDSKEGLLTKAAFKLADSDAPKVHIPKFSEISMIQWGGLGFVLTFIGCLIAWQMLKAPIIVGDSFASYEASLQTLVDKAPEEKKSTLKKSIVLLTQSSSAYRNRDSFGGSEKVAASVVYSRVDGLTADQIIQMAESDLIDQRKLFENEIAQAKQEATDLKAQIKEQAKSNGDLSKLKISDLKFAWQNTAAPEMMLKLTNQSDIIITKVFFQGYLEDASGKRLVSEPFAYGTAMGIRPGASKYVTLSPAEESAWAIVDQKTNWRALTFSATVENALNQDGKEIGIDLRPLRKKLADGNERVKRLEAQLIGIKL